MSRAMIPESLWLDMADIFVALDGDGPAFLRVVRASLPGVALGFVAGGLS